MKSINFKIGEKMKKANSHYFKGVYIAMSFLIMSSTLFSCMKDNNPDGSSAGNSYNNDVSGTATVMSDLSSAVRSSDSGSDTRSQSDSSTASTGTSAGASTSGGKSSGETSSSAANSSKSSSRSSAVPSSTPTQSVSSLKGYSEFLKKASEGKNINVAFLGGSITAGASYANWGSANTYTGTNIDGTPIDVTQYWSYASNDDLRDSWRGRVYGWLKTTYEKREGQFKQINAAIGATDSLFGALRLEDHVFSQGIPDIIFIEFAVNDNGKNATDVMRSYESIVKRVIAKNPDCAIFFALSTSRQKIDAANPAFYDVILNSVKIAQDYADYKKIPYANIDNAYYHGNLTAAQKTALFYGAKTDGGAQVHPSPYGYEIYANEVIKVLKSCFSTDKFKFANVSLLLPEAYPENGRMIFGDELVSSMPGSSAVTIPDDPRQHKCMTYHKMLVGSNAGAELNYSFKGTAIWLWLDYGNSNYRIDLYIDDMLLLSNWTFESSQLKFLTGYMTPGKTYKLKIILKSAADTTKPLKFGLRGLAIENYKP